MTASGIILNRQDVYYLSFEEFRNAVKTNKIDYSIISDRKKEYEIYEKLTPPRVKPE
ncbi:MAG: pyruvate phosphate dikinase, PEP/pyruvate-binding [Clostridiaceae bacterium]|jgi:pyruvate,water dikinase|nr:pyruvate phosphate dikinase, PEP/pyruvate-binding [Clostridiaceae bacterium]